MQMFTKIIQNTQYNVVSVALIKVTEYIYIMERERERCVLIFFLAE